MCLADVSCRCVLSDLLGFAVASPFTAHTKPHCQFVFLRSRVCYPLLLSFTSRLRLCGFSLRLPSSAPIGSPHPTRFCPCWAHWRRLPLESSSSHCHGNAMKREQYTSAGGQGLSGPCQTIRSLTELTCFERSCTWLLLKWAPVEWTVKRGLKLQSGRIYLRFLLTKGSRGQGSASPSPECQS
jgi:hypothetical protein